MAREDEEWVSKREFEILKDEFAGVKSELEKRNKDIQGLKRGKHACNSRQHCKWARTYANMLKKQQTTILYLVLAILDHTLHILPMLHFSSAAGWSR